MSRLRRMLVCCTALLQAIWLLLCHNEQLSVFSPLSPRFALSFTSLPSPPFPLRRRGALLGWGSVMVTMVPGSRYVCSAHAREDDRENDREERILAVLGIIGTVLNLLVVIFVYIYTSVT